MKWRKFFQTSSARIFTATNGNAPVLASTRAIVKLIGSSGSKHSLLNHQTDKDDKNKEIRQEISEDNLSWTHYQKSIGIRASLISDENNNYDKDKTFSPDTTTKIWCQQKKFLNTKYRSDGTLSFSSIFYLWFITIFIVFSGCQIPTFFRLTEANYLDPETIQIQQQQLHHHRHHPHQMLDLVKKAALLQQQQHNSVLDGSIPASFPSTKTEMDQTITSALANRNNSASMMRTSTSTSNSQTIPIVSTNNNNRRKKKSSLGNKSNNIAPTELLSNKRDRHIFDVDGFVPPGYDKLMPPKQNGRPTKVRFHVWVLGLDSIDEGSMSYVADIFMSQSWKDNRLVIPDDITFNVNSSSDPRGPYRLLPLTLIDKIWRPDSFFKNAKEVTFQEMTIPNHYIWLYSDNTILYMVKLTLLLSCAMKFQTYPHDTQNCTMKIESLSYTTNDLVFDWEESDPLVVEEHIELPQHDLIRKDIDYCTTDYSSGTFACVQVVFTIKRRLGYYIFHTYIPTCLIVIMSWISFWIKPEAVPARVTLCVTSLLTLSTQHAQSQKSLPPVSYIKAIDIFMSSCTVFVFASLMEYALVNILMSDELLNGWIGIAPTAYQEAPHVIETRQPRRSKVPSSNHPVRFHSLTRLDKLDSNIDSIHGSIRSEYNDEYNDRKSDGKLNEETRATYAFGDESIPSNTNANRSSILRHRYSSIKNNNEGKNNDFDPKNLNEESRQYKQQRNSIFQSFSFQKPMSATEQYHLQSKHKRAYTVDHISRWIFPLSFIILNLVYWTYYLELLESFGIPKSLKS